VINILGVVILFAAVIGTIGAFYRERKTIHIIYLVVVLIAFVFQIITAVVVYQLTANARIWLSKIWSEETKEYREYAQTKVIVLLHDKRSFKNDSFPNSFPAVVSPIH
jgi:ABC-type Fe3+-siderophore transport system permease subunit